MTPYVPIHYCSCMLSMHTWLTFPRSLPPSLVRRDDVAALPFHRGHSAFASVSFFPRRSSTCNHFPPQGHPATCLRPGQKHTHAHTQHTHLTPMRGPASAPLPAAHGITTHRRHDMITHEYHPLSLFLCLARYISPYTSLLHQRTFH